MKFKSPVFSEASGSIAGIVYSHNKGGLYIRARSVPTNPNTARQQAVRAAMGGVLAYWTSTLTDAQRQAWDTYAQKVPVLDRLGELRPLSGQQHFLRSNIQRVVAGISIIAAAPTVFDTGEPLSAQLPATGFSINAGVYDEVLNFAAPASEAGHCLLFLSKPVPSSRSFFKGPYQYAGLSIFAASDTTVTFAIDTTGASWFADYVPADGNRVHTRYVNAFVDGRYSQPMAVFQTANVA